jgi:hypothetical protein
VVLWWFSLRFLNRQTLIESLQGLITLEEIDQLLARRDGIIKYFDALVESEGYEKVVLEENQVINPSAPK